MYRYVLRKFVEAILTLLVLSLVVFAAVRLTGDPVAMVLGQSPERATKEIEDKIRKDMGLDKPFVAQYYFFLKGLVTKLDFGNSYLRKKPVRDMLLDRIPNTLQLAGTAILLTLLFGVPLGVLSAVKRGSVFDKVARLIAIVGMATPQFWLAIMLILLFGARLQWLPTYGSGGINHLVLPAVVLSLALTAAMMRLGRSSMLEILESEYVRFARVKGLRERLVIWKHALRNALIPLLTFGGLSLAGLLNGSVVVEVIFAWPGVGRLMLQGVVDRDFNVVMATVLVSAFFYISTAFIVDLLYAYADPRIRYA